MVADTIAAGVQATASLPLYRLDGTLLGAMGFAWAEPTSFDRKLEAALRAVAYLCVETVERAERYDADHDLIVALQNRLLGNLPVLRALTSQPGTSPRAPKRPLGATGTRDCFSAKGGSPSSSAM